MQFTFNPNCSVEEYVKQGKSFDFPKLKKCPRRKCRNHNIHKHGFYERNCFDGYVWYRILIRRYYCPSCGITISYLPSFCLRWFQYCLECFKQCLVARFQLHLSLKKIALFLKDKFENLSWSKSQIHRYLHRFLGNLPKIELVLRAIDPHCFLGPLSEDKAKRAGKALDIIDGLEIHSFHKLYADLCQSSFLAPVR